MKAVRIHRFGGPEALSVDELDRPQPGSGEALIRVLAASVNPVDFKTRSGHFPVVKQEDLPIVLGRDVAGIVELCGPGMTSKSGDEIYAMLGSDRGGYTQYVMVKPGEFAPKPKEVSFVEAAAIPLAGLTAWQGLFDQGQLTSGQRVLIHGGAGGVGHLALQFAKARGAWAATTVSAADLDFVRELGADQVVNYKTQRFEDEVDPVDLVFDLVAGETQNRSWSVVKSGGALVSTLQKPDEDVARRRNIRALSYMTRPDAAQLAEIAKLVDEGKVRPWVNSTFRLNEAAAAQQTLEKEHVRGKIVLEVAA